jgi:crotonobetainyl-CoA:carnitine CoA-transferase CaiB-like acyl-CoA transferase
MQLAANPVRMSATPPTTRIAPPALGHHTEQVMMELLGLSERELLDLRDVGAI